MRLTRLTPLALIAVVSAAPHRARAADPNMAACLTANENAIKLREEHKLRQARDQSLICTARSCPGEVREACQNRITQLNSAIPTVVFEVKDADGNDLSHVAVTMDGEPLADRLDGTPIPLDPGEHTFVFAVGGYTKQEKRLVVYQGETNRRERIQFAVPLARPSPTPASGSQGEPASNPPPAEQAPSSASLGLGFQRVIGLTLAGVGVVGVGVGSVLGLVASSAWSRVKAACGPGGPSSCATDDANRSSVVSDRDTAQKDGTLATITIIGGGALIATGLVLFLTGPQRESATPVALSPSLGPGQAGFACRGAF
jgi:hypothetical protein